MVVGGTIGVSIFRLPGPTATLLGSTWLILAVWTFGGAFTLLNANYMAELATMIPKAGGPYVMLVMPDGDFAGFVVGWSDWLGNAAAVAFLPIAFAEYAIALFAPSFAGVTTVAIAFLLLLTFLNWIGVRAGSGTQKLTSFLKAIALLVFVIACFALSGRHTSTNLGPTTLAAPASSFAWLVAIVLSFQLILGVTESGTQLFILPKKMKIRAATFHAHFTSESYSWFSSICSLISRYFMSCPCLK